MADLPGMIYQDHTFTAPLIYGDDTSPAIEIFAREVVHPDHRADDLPWLCFLNGGPGMRAPRPPAPSWLPLALRTYRVLLLDQRGSGRSTPLTGQTIGGRSDTELASYLSFLRADSIVADAELIRQQLTGGRPWTTLGQSYGGFVTLTYLSAAPQGLSGCLVTGGLPGVHAGAGEVYARTYERVADRNRSYYERYPHDVPRVRAIADHLSSQPVLLPDGDRLTPERFRSLGKTFGSSGGLERVHWLVEGAWVGDALAEAFLYAVMTSTGFTESPLFALQEFIYGRPGERTGWAAERELGRRPEFAADADPLLFTGEMFYRWMFSDLRALRGFAGAAQLLARRSDWPALYDPVRLAFNEVPVVAAVYPGDMHVDADLQLDTAGRVSNLRTWVSEEYEHDGLTASDGAVLEHLLGMLREHV